MKLGLYKPSTTDVARRSKEWIYSFIVGFSWLLAFCKQDEFDREDGIDVCRSGSCLYIGDPIVCPAVTRQSTISVHTFDLYIRTANNFLLNAELYYVIMQVCTIQVY